MKMPYWYYEKEELRNTLSIQDGMDYETECRYRKEGAQLISDIGIKLVLGYNTVATGVVYFHRFYMFQSFKTFPRNVTACCCLFLAGKVEETPKKCKDILITARTLLSEREFRKFGHDPINEIMILERILLQTIKFDLEVEHPYGYLLKYAKFFKGDKNKIRKMLQMAWTFVNDSLHTTLSLQWEAEIIAVALMYLAGKLSKLEVSDWQGSSSKHRQWWNMFVQDVTKDLMEGTSELSLFVFKNLDKKHFDVQSFIDICHQVMEPYSSMPESSTTTTGSSKLYKNRSAA